jgi:hypothetical protein
MTAPFRDELRFKRIRVYSRDSRALLLWQATRSPYNIGSKGEDISTRAMMDYFKPLMSWLEERNKGRQIGWE